ncbi:hypothetical protein GCK32_015997, partial [Trichostrongylus colubriformis]
MGEVVGPPASLPAQIPISESDGSPLRVVDPVDRFAALIVRGTIVGMGLAGVALFLRNSRLFARFEHVAQIPSDFIRKELQLKGTVREVLPSGELRVEHSPIVALPSILSRKRPVKARSFEYSSCRCRHVRSRTTVHIKGFALKEQTDNLHCHKG